MDEPTGDDFGDPAVRARLAEELTAAEYNRRLDAWNEAKTVAVVNGWPIRPAATRFGTVWQIIGAGVAYETREGAEVEAGRLRGGPRA